MKANPSSSRRECRFKSFVPTCLRSSIDWHFSCADKQRMSSHFSKWLLSSQSLWIMDRPLDSLLSPSDSSRRSFQGQAMHPLMSLSGGLAEVKHQKSGTTVQFIHQSVNDYLLSNGHTFLILFTKDIDTQGSLQSDSSSTDSIIGQSQHLLTKACINYLKLEEVVQNQNIAETKILQQQLSFNQLRNWVLVRAFKESWEPRCSAGLYCTRIQLFRGSIQNIAYKLLHYLSNLFSIPHKILFPERFNIITHHISLKSLQYGWSFT